MYCLTVETENTDMLHVVQHASNLFQDYHGRDDNDCLTRRESNLCTAVLKCSMVWLDCGTGGEDSSSNCNYEVPNVSHK